MLMHRGELSHRSPERAGACLPGSLGVALGFGASIVVTMLAWGLSRAFGAGGDPRISLVLLTVTAIGIGAGTTVPGAIGAGGLCWACYSGFVLDRFGMLTLDRGGGRALLTMVLAAAAASAVAGLVGWARAVAADHASASSPLPMIPTAPAVPPGCIWTRSGFR